jgi:hypothetical protein
MASDARGGAVGGDYLAARSTRAGVFRRAWNFSARAHVCGLAAGNFFTFFYNLTH